ncbi:MAG: hypothetical protein CBC11_002275 [Proteobacteria bacterium TMED51]|nr:MAG: hypothetical protein CBC11_002275 [Proteobacteria bacterium TMED51]
MWGNKSSQDNTDVYFTFVLKLRASHLWVAPYSSYQQFLYDTIVRHQKNGWNYQQIAEWLNENDYKTPRGHKFLNAHAQSIVKKKHLRDARLTKRYPPRLSDFAISFVDKTLINKTSD